MTVWTDRSTEALELKKRLREKGYDFKEIQTAGTAPVVCNNGYFLFGYSRIYTSFELLAG